MNSCNNSARLCRLLRAVVPAFAIMTVRETNLNQKSSLVSHQSRFTIKSTALSNSVFVPNSFTFAASFPWAQMITLEEAAEKLGITPERGVKKRLKTDPEFKRLSQIRDGAAVRFKLSAIEELGRQLGQASDEGLPMKAVEDETLGSDEFKVEAPEKKKGKKQDDSPLEFTDSSEEDVFLARG